VIRAFLSRQFLLFLLTGGTAAVVNFVTRLIYNQWMSFSSAVVLSYITGMVTAFVLARLFVFKASTQTLSRSAAFFILVNGLAILQTWAISMVMAYYVLPALDVQRYTLELAHAVGIVVPVFTSFIGHKYWSFR
jgi:putative flippase GtrA